MINDVAIIVSSAFGVAFVFLIGAIVIQKRLNKQTSKKHGLARDYIFKHYFDQEEVRKPVTERFFFDAFIEVETQVSLDPDVRAQLVTDIMATRFCRKQFKRINSRNTIKRKLACFYLGALQHDDGAMAIKRRLFIEKNESVRFYLIHALKHDFDQEIIARVMTTLDGATAIYRRWIYTLLCNHHTLVKPHLQTYVNEFTPEIMQLLLYLARQHRDDYLKTYAFQVVERFTHDVDMQTTALEALAQTYPEEVATEAFFQHPTKIIKTCAIKASANILSTDMVDFLLDSMDGSELDNQGVNALSRITFDAKQMLVYLLESYPRYRDVEYARKAIVRVLAHRIDYLMLKMASNQHQQIMEIIENMLELHIVEDFIDFMNRNRDPKIENQMLGIIKRFMVEDEELLNEFSIYLRQDILIKMGMMKKTPPMPPREKPAIEKKKISFVIRNVLFGLMFMPLVFLIKNAGTLITGVESWFVLMIVEFNYYLVFYFVVLNSIYLIVLLFSLKGAKERLDLWRIKKQTLLFEHDLLPSISILAPAYNEEKSIVESVTSLLNLKYPKYEVIVINDGSKDNTISVLIDHFELERKHPFFKQPIATRGLRGVYVNKHIPNLIVVDKVNGGKADALNMGINVAKHDYVCGIDADSLLEEEALLKLISVTLDNSVPHIALGGNIVPVNGCIVDQGKIEQRGLGKKPLVRFQSLEYLRAFTTGRIGWSKLKSLLIVSGAFGLFERKALISTGGYLTISGKLKKDTVGEDMELVVRLTVQALERKQPYRVEYIHHANCYTELPSDFSSLLKQRNRWQRGLIDILSYHRRMLFNPSYKQPGVIAFPYFFLFEMIGPFIEIVGFAALITGAILGILNLEIFILLFMAGIGYGIIISLFSLLIAERRIVLYSNKETAIMMAYAILENFGYRQIMSIHRAVATFKSLNESGAWGSQKRQGFQTKKQSS